MPNGKGFRGHADSKTQPGKPGGHEATYTGTEHDFNIKGKITNNKDSAYHDLANPYSGANGNYSQKDSQLKYLTERGKKGISVSNFNATHRTDREHTNNVGPTAYNSRPIDQTYKPATSQGVPTAEQVVYNSKEKKVIKGANGSH